ncbi:general secretion pathway protein K [Thauera sp. 28]|uniref:type II secretion system minor pseudopilin GspK n=1 Tax=unclassified Thauera TaxID=2609274 RepID=UPI0002D13315|nr:MULTISPECIES: type II secretion system minor pseudopilin GspK [unclassified Thauera]ENO92221.1 general secretion pathway protein K [Thauera sp. 28]WBL62450.1 type II secretion system minor pseudopilin GspK [Thauera sp. WB-2]
MWERFAVCSRCAKGHARQRGAAIVLALLTVGLAAVLAAAALADLSLGIEVHEGRFEQAQSRQLAIAAVDWTRNVLADDRRTSAADHAGEPWAIEIPPTPIDRDPKAGTVGGRINELSGRFDLNALHPGNPAHASARGQAERLFALVLGDAVRARLLADALEAHLQPATGTESGKQAFELTEVGELIAIPAFTPEAIAQLTPHVATLPARAPINANMASAEVLAATIDGLDLSAARTMVAARTHTWFRNRGDIAALLGPGLDLPAASALDVHSRFFIAHIHAGYGEAITRLQALLDRRQTSVDIIWYRIE